MGGGSSGHEADNNLGDVGLFDPSISADDDDRRRRIRDWLLSPVDLSGYSRRRGTDGMLGGRHDVDDDDGGNDNTPRSPTRTTTRTTPAESSKSAYAAARHGSEFFASVARGRGRVDETKSVGRLLLPSFSGPDDELFGTYSFLNRKRPPIKSLHYRGLNLYNVEIKNL